MKIRENNEVLEDTIEHQMEKNQDKIRKKRASKANLEAAQQTYNYEKQSLENEIMLLEQMLSEDARF